MTVTATILLVVYFTANCVLSEAFSGQDSQDLSGRNLTSVPQTISAFTAQLILSYNLLTAIKYGDFNRMINLSYLDISNNRIRVLNKMSFKGLTQLKVLNMSSNLLRDNVSLPEGLFQPLSSSLLELDLRHNSMTRRYPDNVIKDLISLRILKLDCINGKAYFRHFFQKFL